MGKMVSFSVFSYRLQLTLLRCEKSVQCLGCVAKRQIPVVNIAGHALEKLPRYRLFIQVPRQPHHHVVSNLDLRNNFSFPMNYC